MALRNSELPDFSAEQFYGTEPSPTGAWREGRFVVAGRTVDYYEFVRTRMAGGVYEVDPEHELVTMLQDLCQDFRDRATAVQVAIADELHQKAHPSNLPANIYGTTGEWEIYSTPSRDARLKTSLLELVEQATKSVQRAPDPAALARTLLALYDRETHACALEYTNSADEVVTLDLGQAIDRVLLMSFDPYHCPELRWGETDPARLASCRDDLIDRAWYEAEAGLRNTLDRNYEERMGFSLQELRARERRQPVEAPELRLPKRLEPFVK